MENKYNDLLKCGFTLAAQIKSSTDSLLSVYELNKLAFDEYNISKNDIEKYLKSEYSFYEIFFDNIRHLSKEEFIKNNNYKRELTEIINLKKDLLKIKEESKEDVDILT